MGAPYPDVKVRVGNQDELLVRGPGVMQGYMNNPEATAETIDSKGWLHTGDKARIENGKVFITGRIKEIIIMANGEKLPPRRKQIIERYSKEIHHLYEGHEADKNQQYRGG